MSREPRKLIDLLVAVVVLTLAVLGFARPASAYPPGTALTVNVKSVTVLFDGDRRVEFIVRHAKPGAIVKLNFEDLTKQKNANSSGIAVFSFRGPGSGVHLAAAYSRSERASTAAYLTNVGLLRLRAAADSTNYVTVTSAKPGSIVTVKYGNKMKSATVNAKNRALIGFTVPKAGNYSIKVFIGSTQVASYNAVSY
ncbi:MAG: hypothetical protein RL441_705 [Actinomycetota bacterium]|jgi:hypothetical protein